jgi:hypothetical protein
MFVEQTFYGFRKAKNIEKGLHHERKKNEKGSKRQSLKVAINIHRKKKLMFTF